MSASPTSPQDSPAEAEASCRLPLLVFFGGAAFWLVAASVLGHLASIKLHAPSFLSDCALLTYGRLHPAATNALLYGFASQAAFGVALWLVARLGRVAVPQPFLVGFAGKIWNLGVLAGVAGIIAGDSTGFEWLEMPRYAAVPLFFSSLFISLWTLLVFHRRQERSLAVSQWYLVAALLWFPWIYTTANALLFCHPVRGVMQAIVGW
jgi:cytochrome c oxidase cbb3-type subunit 1